MATRTFKHLLRQSLDYAVAWLKESRFSSSLVKRGIDPASSHLRSPSKGL
jgi:hypothetical protein